MTRLVRRESEFLLYRGSDGAVKVGVLFRDETAWLTQKALAELFGVKVPAINKHLQNIFESGELAEDSVISILETTAADGKNYSTRFYNLDAIIAATKLFMGLTTWKHAPRGKILKSDVTVASDNARKKVRARKKKP